MPPPLALNLSTARDFLRRKFATDLTGLRREIERVGAMAMNTRLNLTGQSFEGGSHNGEVAFTAMEYLRALLDVEADLDPTSVGTSGYSSIRYADHSSRYAE